MRNLARLFSLLLVTILLFSPKSSISLVQKAYAFTCQVKSIAPSGAGPPMVGTPNQLTFEAQYDPSDGDLSEIEEDLHAVVYNGSAWVDPTRKPDMFTAVYENAIFPEAKEYVVAGAWIYKVGGVTKSCIASACLGVFDSFTEVPLSLSLVHPNTQVNQVISDNNRCLGYVAGWWFFGSWSGNHYGYPPIMPPNPSDQVNNWKLISSASSDDRYPCLGSWSCEGIYSAQGNWATRYYVNSAAILWGWPPGSAPAAYPTSVTYTLRLANFPPLPAGVHPWAKYENDGLSVYSRPKRGGNCNRSCPSLPPLSVGIIEVSLFQDLNLDGIKDSGEALVPTSVLGSTNVYLMAKSLSGSYTAFSFVGENYVQKAVAQGDSYRVVMKQSEIPASWVVTKWSVNYTGSGQPAPITTTYKDCQQWGLATHCTVSEGADADWPLSINPNYTAHVYLGLKEIPTYTLSGRVWMDTVTKTCAVNTDEPKLQGRTVTVTGLGKSGVTDANGSYSITGIPAGTYEVCVDAPAGNPYLACRKVRDAGGTWADAPATSSLCSQVTITTLDKNLNLGFRPTYTLSGRVWEDNLVKNCWVNDGEPRLANRTVSIASLGLSDQTDSYGNYSISSIPAGTYTVCVDTPTGTWDLACARERVEGGTFGPAVNPPNLCYDITLTDTNKNLNLGLRRTYTLSGRLWKDTVSKNCWYNSPEEQTLPAGINVSVEGTSLSDLTDNQGNYSITGVPADISYNICVTNAPANYDLTCANVKDGSGEYTQLPDPPTNCVSITINDINKTLNLGFRPKWNLTGYVWNDTPAPNCAWDAAPPPQEGKFNNLNISVTGTDPLKTGATGPNGENYSITDIEEGSYSVCTTKPTTYDWKLMCAKDESGANLTITGDCAALSLITDKTLNFGLRQIFPPWFQVSDSDVHSNGDLTVDISSQATNKCFVAVGRGFGGLVTAVGDINLNGQPVSCIVTKRWQIPQYDPIDWAKTVRLNWSLLTEGKDPPGWGNLEPNTVYYKKDGLDVTPPGYKVSGGGVAVMVVEGNLNFNGDFNANDPDKMGLIFLVRNGQTTVAKNVETLDALVLNEKGPLEEGGRITVQGGGQQKDEVLTVNGGLFAEEGLSFQRDRALEDDENKEPVVILNFNPLYLALLGPDLPGLSTHYISWREVQINQ